MEKVLITGAAGFIGSHLCDRFLNEGFNVIGIDNFLTGTPENIKHIMDNEKFKFIKKDVSENFSISEDLDAVLHFACPASPQDYFAHPIETLKVDSIGTLNTLNLAKKKEARYIFASTSEIYGDPEIHPQVEDYWGHVNPIGPRSVYDEAKRFSESLTMAYYREYGLDIRILRIFNTYGPRMKLNDGRVVPNFISQALKEEDITVYGDGSQTRSFCYVEDLIEGIFQVLIKDNIGGEVFNLGNPDEYEIIDFARIIIEKTNSKSDIIFKPLPEDDPQRRRPDISKVRKIINWQPKFSLDEGLERSIKYFQSKI